MALKNRPRRKFKTKKTVSGGPRPHYHGWKNWVEGDYIIGKFVKTTKDNYENKVPVLEVLEANLTTPVTNKEKEEIDIVDKHLVLNSAGSIAYAFFKEDEERGKESIQAGEIVQVLYLGKMAQEDWQGEGQPPHQIQVDVLEEEESEEDDVEVKEEAEESSNDEVF